MRRALVLICVASGALSACGSSEPTVAIAPEAAESLVSRAVNQAADYNPEVACPQTISGGVGSEFTCEANVRGSLVPVKLEIASPAGFIRVRETNALRSLADNAASEEALAKREDECENLNVSQAAGVAETRCLAEVDGD